jgi:hypothetical protein
MISHSIDSQLREPKPQEPSVTGMAKSVWRRRVKYPKAESEHPLPIYDPRRDDGGSFSSLRPIQKPKRNKLTVALDLYADNRVDWRHERTDQGAKLRPCFKRLFEQKANVGFSSISPRTPRLLLAPPEGYIGTGVATKTEVHRLTRPIDSRPSTQYGTSRGQNSATKAVLVSLQRSNLMVLVKIELRQIVIRSH